MPNHKEVIKKIANSKNDPYERWVGYRETMIKRLEEAGHKVDGNERLFYLVNQLSFRVAILVDASLGHVPIKFATAEDALINLPLDLLQAIMSSDYNTVPAIAHTYHPPKSH